MERYMYLNNTDKGDLYKPVLHPTLLSLSNRGKKMENIINSGKYLWILGQFVPSWPFHATTTASATNKIILAKTETDVPLNFYLRDLAF